MSKVRRAWLCLAIAIAVTVPAMANYYFAIFGIPCNDYVFGYIGYISCNVTGYCNEPLESHNVNSFVAINCSTIPAFGSVAASGGAT